MRSARTEGLNSGHPLRKKKKVPVGTLFFFGGGGGIDSPPETAHPCGASSLRSNVCRRAWRASARTTGFSSGQPRRKKKKVPGGTFFFLAEGVGFEPTEHQRCSLDFESSPFDHSGTPPSKGGNYPGRGDPLSTADHKPGPVVMLWHPSKYFFRLTIPFNLLFYILLI